MTREEARKELHVWLTDMEALRPYADPNATGDNHVFSEAFSIARKRALVAAQAYVEATE